MARPISKGVDYFPSMLAFVRHKSSQDYGGS